MIQLQAVGAVLLLWCVLPASAAFAQGSSATPSDTGRQFTVIRAGSEVRFTLVHTEITGRLARDLAPGIDDSLYVTACPACAVEAYPTDRAVAFAVGTRVTVRPVSRGAAVGFVLGALAGATLGSMTHYEGGTSTGLTIGLAGILAIGGGALGALSGSIMPAQTRTVWRAADLARRH